jgi:hypothetical protein
MSRLMILLLCCLLTVPFLSGVAWAVDPDAAGENPVAGGREVGKLPPREGQTHDLGPQYIPLIVLGLALLFWGFYAAHESRRPWDILGAVAAPLGLITALLGTLLVCVPKFFSVE